jgi:putative transposase
VKYACIEMHRGDFHVSVMCHVLDVSRSGYYAARKLGLRQRELADQRLRLEIRSVHRASNRRYGSPRVHWELKAQGILCGKNRVERLMREDGLRAKPRRRFRVTTDSSHAHPIAPNLLERRFTAEEVGGPDQTWVADITYIPTRQGWLYLSIMLDLASRRVVGWAMKDTLEASLATDALRMALSRRRPAPGLLHHSDRGVQYAAGEYRALLDDHGIICSMSRKGNCWDNAVAESFFATLEWELIEESDWHSHSEAKRAIFEYLEVWYNRRRRHSTLGYKSPAEYEEKLALTPRAA